MSSWRFRKWKPSVQESLLLQSAFLTGNRAIDSWKSWKENINWQTINKSSVDLFPFVYTNLSPLIEDSLWPKFKGVIFKNWSWNHLLFEKVKPALQLLSESKISFLILKGGALLYRYPNPGLRYSGDYDLLVKPTDFLKTTKLLQKHSWQFEKETSLSKIKFKQEIHLSKENLYTIDLHQRASHLTAHPELEKNLWQYQEKFIFLEQTLSRPADTELLFTILAHGFRIDANMAPRHLLWIADSLLILKDNSTDWDRFCYLSKKTSLRYVIGFALSYLKNNFLNKEIPENVITNLTSGVPTKEERVTYFYSLHPSFLFYRKNRFRRIMNYYSLFLFFNGRIDSLSKKPVTTYIFCFPQYLINSYGVKGYRGLVLALFKKLKIYVFKKR